MWYILFILQLTITQESEAGQGLSALSHHDIDMLQNLKFCFVLFLENMGFCDLGTVFLAYCFAKIDLNSACQLMGLCYSCVELQVTPKTTYIDFLTFYTCLNHSLTVT